MSDLVEWLTKILDEDSDPSEAPHGLGCSYVADGGRFGLLPCDCGIPELWRADIAAKRAIIAVHKLFSEEIGNRVCDECGHLYPCQTLHLLATAYASRPGYHFNGWQS